MGKPALAPNFGAGRGSLGPSTALLGWLLLGLLHSRAQRGGFAGSWEASQ